MKPSTFARLGIVGVIVVVALALAGCNGAGALPSGQVHLYIDNPSSSGAPYQSVFLTASSPGGTSSTLPDIASGSIYDAHVTPGTYTLSFTYSPAPSNPQSAILNVPSTGCKYTGPATPTGTGSGCP